ncbi:MAG: VWA domain-containing protein [Planctomycetales bacterium]|jgi:Ca-activated chloride channel family protein
MVWETPTFLFALWLAPLIGGLFVYAHRKRKATAATFAEAAMVERLMPPFESGRVWGKTIVMTLAVAFLIVACARPRFGVFFEDVSGRGVDLFVLLDVSRSMLAEDVAPNRLERAKSDVVDLLQKLEGDRVGLIAFAGAPVELVPLTTDHGFFRMVLDDVDPDSAPRGGSLIGDAIRKAMEAMEERQDRDQVIVLITDGEDHDSFPAEAAQQAADRNIRIISVGLGDTGEGARIPKRAEDGSLVFTKHDGQEVWSKMDESLLKEIALATSGAYVPARTTAYDLGLIYDEHLAKLTRGEFQSEKRKRYREQFQLFGGIGLALLLIEMLIPRFGGQRRQSAEVVA